jgi:hypothetical protein
MKIRIIPVAMFLVPASAFTRPVTVTVAQQARGTRAEMSRCCA